MNSNLLSFCSGKIQLFQKGQTNLQIIQMKGPQIQQFTHYLVPDGQASSIDYAFHSNSRQMKTFHSMLMARKLIDHFFSSINVLSNKPVFMIATNSVIVHVYYYSITKDQTLNNHHLNHLGEALTALFKRPVELRFVKLHHPYLNSEILAKFIAANTQDYTLAQIVRFIFSAVAPIKSTSGQMKTYLPAFIVGIKVRVSGRLMTERSRPRQTTQTMQVGSFTKTHLSQVDSASFNTQNKKGAFTVKVWISQRAMN